MAMINIYFKNKLTMGKKLTGNIVTITFTDLEKFKI